MEMMAMTTNNSINVKPAERDRFPFDKYIIRYLSLLDAVSPRLRGPNAVALGGRRRLTEITWAGGPGQVHPLIQTQVGFLL